MTSENVAAREAFVVSENGRRPGASGAPQKDRKSEIAPKADSTSAARAAQPTGNESKTSGASVQA
ncbi:hypothetical protein ACKI14_50115, partial [Streptomyces turgidiscabies]|uniref:hypothetical protein n=1 Tax=Streptomyces turgidiscabies TaxID=85558 RepID=UPI0038F78950